MRIIALTLNPQSHGKMQHIDTKYHFVREKVQDETVELHYCPTNNMVADFLTKGLSSEDSIHYVAEHALLSDIM